MVDINKKEKELIEEIFPDIHITILNKQSSHKKYKVDAEKKVLEFLNSYRKSNIIFDSSDK